MTPTWIAADWGTSNVRFWAIDADGSVLDMRKSDKGMGSLAPSEFEAVLVRKAYEAADGNQTRAARLLGLNRDKFRYRLKQYGIKDQE